MNILEKIIVQKKKEVEKIKHLEEKMRIASLSRQDYRSLLAHIKPFEKDDKDKKISIICEVKKSSPSAGDIVDNFNAVDLACEYENGGAAAISVLTDRKFFKGNIRYLQEIREKTHIPLLRKDFIIDKVQVYESVLAGADAILLIVACLSKDKLYELHEIALNYQLEVLVEVHNLEELDVALGLGNIEIIGINNRNLKTFKVDLNTSIDLCEQVDNDIALVSESGIKTGKDTKELFESGVDAVLVGESLMRVKSKSTLINDLINF